MFTRKLCSWALPFVKFERRHQLGPCRVCFRRIRETSQGQLWGQSIEEDEDQINYLPKMNVISVTMFVSINVLSFLFSQFRPSQLKNTLCRLNVVTRTNCRGKKGKPVTWCSFFSLKFCQSKFSYLMRKGKTWISKQKVAARDEHLEKKLLIFFAAKILFTLTFTILVKVGLCIRTFQPKLREAIDDTRVYCVWLSTVTDSANKFDCFFFILSCIC